MRNHRLTDILAALVTLGSAACLAVAVSGWPPAADRKPIEASGWMMARQAVARLKPGGRLVAITRDTDAFKHPQSALQFRSFEKALRRANVRLDSVLALQVDPLRPLEVPGGDFYELLRKSPAGSVIVSFMGPPLLTPDQARRLTGPRPYVIAFCPGALPAQLDLRVLFEAGWLHTAIISRPAPPRAAARPHSPEDWYTQHFQTVTAAEVGSLYTPGDAAL